MSSRPNSTFCQSLRLTLAIGFALVPAVLTHADEPPEIQLRVIVAGDQLIDVVVQEDAAAQEKAAEAKPAENKPAEKDTAGETQEEKKPSEADLRKKMRDLERELQDARNKFQQKANEQRDKVKKDALKALDDINLPENPTREQCKAFVDELRKACEGRRSYSSSDPATKKLKELPTEHFDLLVTEINNRSSLRYYANYAMREIEPEVLRERFVETIEENPNNIGIIVMHGWCEDVRPAIIKHMQSADGSITPSWFQAAVELDEPSLYPKLHEVTTQSRYASQFLGMLEMLPDYDLAHTVNVCWTNSKAGKLPVNYSTFAAKAAKYGNVEALGSLVDQLRNSSSYLSHSTSYNVRRTNVLRLIDYRGSNKDIQAWYKTHKDDLAFDHLRKRFHLPEDF